MKQDVSKLGIELTDEELMDMVGGFSEDTAKFTRPIGVVKPMYGIKPIDVVQPLYGIKPIDVVQPLYGIKPIDTVKPLYGIMPQK